MTFEQREAVLYAQPRLMSRNMGGVLSQNVDPRKRFECTCERLNVPSFIIRGSRWQCSDKMDSISWREDIAGRAAKLKKLQPK